MSLPKFDPRTTLLFLLIILMAGLRVIFSIGFRDNPMNNFSTVETMALFGGAYFSNRVKALLLPLLTLWFSDLLLDRFLYFHEWKWFYPGFYWTYGAFALMVITGSLLIRKVSLKNILMATVVVVFIHWTLTDFGVWFDGKLYAKTPAGWWACLMAAIPFERNVIAGTTLYSVLFFGFFEWIKRHYPKFAGEFH
jgi:hypothetical protein